MVKAENVHKSFAHVDVLKGINLEVAPKEVFCLVGPSESGPRSCWTGSAWVTSTAATRRSCPAASSSA